MNMERSPESVRLLNGELISTTDGVTIHLTSGFTYDGEVDIPGPFVEVQYWAEDKDEAERVRLIRFNAVESVTWSGDL